MTVTTTGLDEKTREIIKATVPVLEEHGEKITTRFYQLMFQNNPELKNIFNQTNQRKGKQPRALANTVYAAAANIDHLEAILPSVNLIAHKHKSLNIKPEQYPIVGKNLLLAIKDVLGDAATNDIMNAWEKAYGVIADVFITAEKELYNETLNMPGGWVDYRDFKVTKKVVESDVITSFYLEPVDEEPLPIFQAGQYITVKAEMDGQPYNHLRQYTLSCAPGEGFYRISVKREDATSNSPAGIVSSYLHEHIDEGSILPISAPAGEFILDVKDSRPLVLLSGGVGLTPMISMLETVIKEQPEREVVYIHAANSGKVHAMKARVNEIVDKHEQVKSYTVYANPEENDQYDKKGYIDAEWMREILPTNDAACYFCGPKEFMRVAYQILIENRVAKEDIHFEIFGPAEDITN